MATIKIADVDVDVEAHRGSHDIEKEAIFSHLPSKEKYDALRALNAALSAEKKSEQKAAAEAVMSGSEPAKPTK